MKKIFIGIFLLLALNVSAFGAKSLTEENITKMLDKVKVAKEHKNIKVLRSHFLSRTSISLSSQNVDKLETKRLNLYKYQNYLIKKWKRVKSNVLEIKERKFQIEKNGKSALVKTTLKQIIEIDGIKTSTLVYETTGIRLIKGKPYINYYSQRVMLSTSLRVN